MVGWVDGRLNDFAGVALWVEYIFTRVSA
jgi:hypothetical protein